MAKKTIEYGEMATVEVSNVREFDWGVVFDLEINDVKIYGCRLIEHKKRKFIGFPQEQDKKGNYWNRAYFHFSEEDQEKVIKMVEKEL